MGDRESKKSREKLKKEKYLLPRPSYLGSTILAHLQNLKYGQPHTRAPIDLEGEKNISTLRSAIEK